MTTAWCRDVSDVGARAMVASMLDHEELPLPVVGSGPGERAGSSADTFDVSVVAWSDAGEQTVETLEALFGIDRATAERLVSSVPVMVKRGVLLADAESFVRALESVGAQVTMENTPGEPVPEDVGPTSLAPRAPAPTSLPRPPIRRVQTGPVTLPSSAAARENASVSVPGPRPRVATPAPDQWGSRAPVPPGSRVPAPPGSRVPSPPASRVPSQPSRVPTRPISRPISQDVAIELIGNDGHSMRSLGSRPARVRSFDDTEEPDYRRGVTLRGQRNLDLDPGSERLDLSTNALLSRGPAPTLAEPVRSRPQSADLGGEVSGPSLARPPIAGGAAPAASPAATANETPAVRAAPKPPADPRAGRAKRWSVAFGRLFLGLGIAAAGLWFDDSILRGNATIPALGLHAFGIYQLGLGVREVFR